MNISDSIHCKFIEKNPFENIDETKAETTPIGSPLCIELKSNSPPAFHYDEIVTGMVIGTGNYGTVREVTEILLETRGKAIYRLLRSHSSIASLNSIGDSSQCKDAPLNSETREGSVDENLSNDEIEARRSLQRRCIRQGEARYAVKRIRDDLQGDDKIIAMSDLSFEATLLSSLNHPNIVKLRATAGIPNHDQFMLVLDRLHQTLPERISEWRNRMRINNLFFLRQRKRAAKASAVLMERLITSFDVARALKYLHQHNIIHRDIKPENVAYDIRGNVRIFDLGLAKELKKEDLQTPPEDYNCTGLTGSRRWMAPEVYRCEPYGHSSDVYSFGLLLWYICSCKIPFGKIDVDDHYHQVILNGKRPRTLQFLSRSLQNLMEHCWSQDRNQRPSFKAICSILNSEILDLETKDKLHSNIKNRTDHLMSVSIRSSAGV